MMSARSGFSLIEILVALVIVGLMAGIGFGALRYLDRAKITTTEASLRNIQSAIVEYQADTNQLPGKLEDLVKRPANVKGWKLPYATEEQLRDSWKNEFYYRPNERSAARPYELYSYGKGGEESGTEDTKIDVWGL